MAEQAVVRPTTRPRRLDLPRMTYAQFLDWDFENPHVEWLDGEVYVMAPVSDEHQDVAGLLLALLRPFVEVHTLGRILFEPFNMKTAEELPGRSPDILFVATKNLGRVKRNHLKGPADLAIEIVSPGSRGTDRGDKFYEYESGGVKEYWLIDPERRRAEFFRLGRDRQFHPIEIGGDRIFRSLVLKGLWLRVDWLNQRPLPQSIAVLKEWKLV